MDETLTVAQIPPAELKVIIDSFSDKSDPKKVIIEGVKVNGEKYMTIDSDDDTLKTKKVGRPYISKRDRALLWMCSIANTDRISGQRRHRSRKDYAGHPHRPPPGRSPDHQRLQRGR